MGLRNVPENIADVIVTTQALFPVVFLSPHDAFDLILL